MQIDLTPALLADIKSKAAEANFYHGSPWSHKIVFGVSHIVDNDDFDVYSDPGCPAAEFIAAANPVVVLALIARIEELEAKNVS